MQQTENKYTPWPNFTKFKIESSLSPQELTDTLYELFQKHPVLRDDLPCHRYGTNDSRFSCLKVIREDVFHTRFEADIHTLTFSISPRTFDRNYKPDYQHFEKVKNVIAEMLVAHFGKTNITIK